MDGDNSSTAGGSGDNIEQKTLYIGNLACNVTEELLFALFSQFGPVTNCKVYPPLNGTPYGFIEFLQHSSAALARSMMNRRSLFEKPMTVNWAALPKPTAEPKYYQVFIGDLSVEVDTNKLRDAFSTFGTVVDCRVVIDPDTLYPKGYGFVSFLTEREAEAAIKVMNGQWIGNRRIRTGWAYRKVGANAARFNEVYNQTPPTNCTVYCGGIKSGLSVTLILKAFSPFGRIQRVRMFTEKGFAFVKFDSKEAATNAILGVNGTEINGQQVKCSWGKEDGEPDFGPGPGYDNGSSSSRSKVATTTPTPTSLPDNGYRYGYEAGADGYGAGYQDPYYCQQMGYYWYPPTTAADTQNQWAHGMTTSGQGFTGEAAVTAATYQMTGATATKSPGGVAAWVDSISESPDTAAAGTMTTTAPYYCAYPQLPV